MNLEEAIAHAERMAPENKGLSVGHPAFCHFVYYVCPWNDGYIVHQDSHISVHADIDWVYNTRDKNNIL